jgi:uncharacterized membrane protein YfcA
MPRVPRSRTAALIVIGVTAGLFSGLFGVGGGTVMVPLLVLWLGYDTRVATGTSLAAIVIIAAVATLTHGAYGNVRVADALFIGLPAVAGVLAGTWLQQRVEVRTVRVLFAILLLAVAADLVIR